MDVIADAPQRAVAAAAHEQRLVTPKAFGAEQVAKQFVATIKARGVGAQEPTHPGHQIGAGGFEHHVKMISHQTVGVNLPVGLATGFAQGLEEAGAVGIVLVDRLPPIPTIQDTRRAEADA